MRSPAFAGEDLHFLLRRLRESLGELQDSSALILSGRAAEGPPGPGEEGEEGQQRRRSSFSEGSPDREAALPRLAEPSEEGGYGEEEPEEKEE